MSTDSPSRYIGSDASLSTIILSYLLHDPRTKQDHSRIVQIVSVSLVLAIAHSLPLLSMFTLHKFNRVHAYTISACSVLYCMLLQILLSSTFLDNLAEKAAAFPSSQPTLLTMGNFEDGIKSIHLVVKRRIFLNLKKRTEAVPLPFVCHFVFNLVYVHLEYLF